MQRTLTPRAEGAHPLFLRLLSAAPPDAVALAALIGREPDGVFALSNLQIARLFGWTAVGVEAGKLRASRAVAALVEAGGVLACTRAEFLAHLDDVAIYLDPERDRTAKHRLRREDAGRFLFPLWWTPLP